MPIIFDKPIQVWLGMMLAVFLVWQIFSGFMVIKGKPRYMKQHKIIIWFVMGIAAAHIFFGMLAWFF